MKNEKQKIHKTALDDLRMIFDNMNGIGGCESIDEMIATLNELKKMIENEIKYTNEIKLEEN